MLKGLSSAARFLKPSFVSAPVRKMQLAKQRIAEEDPSTLSNYVHFTVQGTDLSLYVDWTKQALRGLVNFKLEVAKPTDKIVLDTSYLDVHSVKVNGKPVPDFSIADRVELGSALTINSGELASGSANELAIEFSTTDKCTALQWLTPEQTAGKKVPYLFSQCQAIHARSLFPCFDTPSIKSKYRFTIQSEHPAVSSGNVASDSESTPEPFYKEAPESTNVYRFVQDIPIPSYLVAIASGDLASADIGPRSLVYSEPSKLKACQWEFEDDTEKFIQVAEKIVFPYDWKTYNVLVLPPSFPYGGMENPNITFATPTLISGDRQNVDVIAHELAHSWSGNLVTNCSWEHFWLNEGWTVYLERRIIGALHGEAHRHFSAIVGWESLESAVETFGESGKNYTKLVVDLKDRQDPDDAFSSVPYEKGSTFLFYLENLLGGKSVFDPFIPYYFDKFRYKSLDSYQFLDTVYEFFSDKKEILDSVDWESWFFDPGLPPKPQFDTSVADACYQLADRWANAIDESKTAEDYAKEFSRNDLESWTSTQQAVFIDTLVSRFDGVKKNGKPTKAAAQALAQVYSFAASSNPEVISRWYTLTVSAELTSEYQQLAHWLGTVGRMKFVRPGFRNLVSVDRKLALETFEAHKEFYHPICRAMVAKDLKI
uniref:Leukotriene A(4) hydrolase n=1 Tax=Blastobotrys adeninivorans TaxID=409370 RepID=A0A060T0L8_BLAAD